MGKMVSSMFSGRAERKAEIASNMATAKAKEDQSVALARQQQEQAVATSNTEQSLGKARRTPRGRRLLVGEQGSTLG